jgi:anti-sigma B factor antagonist
VKTPNLTVRQKGDLVIVDIHGKLNQTDGRQAFRETIGKLKEDGSSRVLLNMAEISDLDPTGLRELLRECGDIAGAGKLKFLNVSKRVRARLQKAGLRHVFATQEDGAWAVHSASASAAARCAPGSEYFFG